MFKIRAWPATEAEVQASVPPEPVLQLRRLSAVEFAFPANVSPDPRAAPEKYNPRDGDPWRALTEELLHGSLGTQDGIRNLRLLARDPATQDDAWRWVIACCRSYELAHQDKIIVVAWVLESFFKAYWHAGEAPEWVRARVAAAEQAEVVDEPC